MAEFKPNPGCVICDKCGGWQVLDYTKRNKASMIPTGPLDYRDCDKCNGYGQIRVEPSYIQQSGRAKRAKVSVDIDVAVPIPIDDVEPAKANCWHINKKTVWGVTRCSDCGEVIE